MGKNMVTIPFDMELAREINDGKREGSIMTVNGNHKVKFVYYNKERIIFSTLGVIESDYGIISDWFSDNGHGSNHRRLKLMVPEYTTFKDGDVLSNEYGDYLFVLNINGEYLTSYHLALGRGDFLYLDDGAARGNEIERFRFADEDERQRFIDALKASKDPRARIYLKRFFGIEKEPEYKFKPFDKVLVKYYEDDDWEASLFIRTITDDQDGKVKYECLNGTEYVYCIPFEGNEHLL